MDLQPDKSRELLAEAAARNWAAVISLTSAGMLRHCKTRFLAVGEEGLWMESAPGEGVLIDALIGAGTAVGVAFKSQTLKTIFITPILQRQPAYRVNSDLTLEAVLLRMPTEVKSVQRRSAYRVHIPSGCEVLVRMWRIPEHAYLKDRPMSTAELTVRPRDLSVGGMGVICIKRGAEPVKLQPDERLRISLAHEAQEEVVLEGRARFLRPLPGGDLQVGVQFKKLEDDLEGRQIAGRLTALVGALQREELRRQRLGVA